VEVGQVEAGVVEVGAPDLALLVVRAGGEEPV
jgi:hypothetical protein